MTNSADTKSWERKSTISVAEIKKLRERSLRDSDELHKALEDASRLTSANANLRLT